MKSLITSVLLIGFLLFLVSESWHIDTVEETQTENTAPLPDYITPIDHKGNGFTGTLTAEQIKDLASAGIRIIIRLNGDTPADIGHLSIDEEARLGEASGIRLYYFNIDAGNRLQKAEQIRNLLSNGNTVVHCRNGVHRAPTMSAYYLIHELQLQPVEAIKKVNLEELAIAPGQYQRYLALLN